MKVLTAKSNPNRASGRPNAVLVYRALREFGAEVDLERLSELAGLRLGEVRDAITWLRGHGVDVRAKPHPHLASSLVWLAEPLPEVLSGAVGPTVRPLEDA